jgi:hypothetical protein
MCYGARAFAVAIDGKANTYTQTTGAAHTVADFRKTTDPVSPEKMP